MASSNQEESKIFQYLKFNIIFIKASSNQEKSKTPQFYYIKVGYKGVTFTMACYPDVCCLLPR